MWNRDSPVSIVSLHVFNKVWDWWSWTLHLWIPPLWSGQYGGRHILSLPHIHGIDHKLVPGLLEDVQLALDWLDVSCHMKLLEYWARSCRQLRWLGTVWYTKLTWVRFGLESRFQIGFPRNRVSSFCDETEFLYPRLLFRIVSAIFSRNMAKQNFKLICQIYFKRGIGRDFWPFHDLVLWRHVPVSCVPVRVRPCSIRPDLSRLKMGFASLSWLVPINWDQTNMDNWSLMVNTLKYVESYQIVDFFKTAFQIFVIKINPKLGQKWSISELLLWKNTELLGLQIKNNIK